MPGPTLEDITKINCPPEKPYKCLPYGGCFGYGSYCSDLSRGVKSCFYDTDPASRQEWCQTTKGNISQMLHSSCQHACDPYLTNIPYNTSNSPYYIYGALSILLFAAIIVIIILGVFYSNTKKKLRALTTKFNAIMNQAPNPHVNLNLGNNNNDLEPSKEETDPLLDNVKYVVNGVCDGDGDGDGDEVAISINPDSATEDHLRVLPDAQNNDTNTTHQGAQQIANNGSNASLQSTQQIANNGSNASLQSTQQIANNGGDTSVLCVDETLNSSVVTEAAQTRFNPQIIVQNNCTFSPIINATNPDTGGNQVVTSLSTYKGE